MPREVNDKGIRMVKQWESLRLTAYLDKKKNGVWTIGYGHTKTAKPGMKITAEEAEKLLQSDLYDARSTVDRLVQVPLSDNQFAALVSLVFNIGEPQFKRSTLLKRLNKGDYSAVPYELMKWVYDDGVRVQGLANRRAAEAGLWAKGEFVSSSYVPTEGKPVKERPMAVLGNMMAASGVAASSFAEKLQEFTGLSENILYWALGLTILGIFLSVIASYLTAVKDSAYE